ncbi:hypothetical protein F511_46505 [Dorcoceras hygrometricum]|uniref:Uncharacterized protein n=1 Tax=Dorcoceras hygrometricum TaxID=472368 RepID=A0A2Z6ZUE2_9LAMI|nr:hypothetical protein F511_46505 [Dorcoceras hygrometricum]
MNLSAVVFISTADESVSSRKKKKKKKKISFISTVDESINSRYSRRRRSVDGAGTKKFSRKLQLEIQQMRRGAKFGLSCDDISLDVITISRWISADDAKRKREATSYCAKIQQVATVLPVESLSAVATLPVATQSIQSQEDSGEAFDDPVASNSSIQS